MAEKQNEMIPLVDSIGLPQLAPIPPPTDSPKN